MAAEYWQLTQPRKPITKTPHGKYLNVNSQTELRPNEMKLISEID